MTVHRSVVFVGLVACGSPHEVVVDAGADASDAGPVRTATGTRLVDHPAVIGGLTSDGFVAFSDLDADQHTVAKVIPIGGGDEIVIATSVGTGKADIRWAIHGSVVFAWTDRGSRVATLTIWSNATGAVPKGPNIRPGRAAATADGAFVAYERDITATTAKIVAGPIASGVSTVGPANSADADCWRDTDFASSGTASSQRLLARYCPGAATAFTLRSVSPDGATALDLSAAAEDATYRPDHVVWRETGGGLAVSNPDGTLLHTLATNAMDFVVSSDETHVVWLDSDGAIFTRAIDGSSAAQQLVAAPAAKQLGAVSEDGLTALFATQIDDRGTGYVAPYTDVLVAALGHAPVTLVPTPTSCTSCVFSTFTPDGQYAVVVDPVDNTQTADASGPLHAFAVADGTSISSFGVGTYSAISVGTSSRFLVLDAVHEAGLVTGWSYGMTVRGLEADAATTVVAGGAEDFALDATHTTAVVSFPDGDAAGIWVAPLR